MMKNEEGRCVLYASEPRVLELINRMASSFSSSFKERKANKGRRHSFSVVFFSSARWAGADGGGRVGTRIDDPVSPA